MSTLPYKMSDFPKNCLGVIIGFDETTADLPVKIIEMGLLPKVRFKVLYQAPFGGPLYIEYGKEHSRIALRKAEAALILVEKA